MREILQLIKFDLWNFVNYLFPAVNQRIQLILDVVKIFKIIGSSPAIPCVKEEARVIYNNSTIRD